MGSPSACATPIQCLRSACAASSSARTSAITSLAKSQGLDAGQVKASIDKAVSEALEGLTVTLEAK